MKLKEWMMCLEGKFPYPPQAWTRPVNRGVDNPAGSIFRGMHDGGPIQGLPIGTLGTGGIGRDYQGGFRRWTIKAGSLKHFVLSANAFSTWQKADASGGQARVLYAGEHDVNAPGAWNFPGPELGGVYRALFPKAWYEYPATVEYPVELVCEQFSPVIPGNYRDSSLPVGLFVWEARNTSDTAADIALMFSFTNMVGWFNDFSEGKPGENRRALQFNRLVSANLDHGGHLRGILFDRQHSRDIPLEGDGQMCIAAVSDDTVEVTWHTSFSLHKDGSEVWEPFSRDGRLSNSDESWIIGPGREIGGAVCARTRLEPNEKKRMVFCLAWDLPVIQFGNGREHFRRYTGYIGTDGRNAVKLASEALESSDEWSAAIDKWHRGILEETADEPDWFHRLLINEAYLLVEGLTVWTAGQVGKNRAEEHFGIIECPDYPFYNTIDLWVYGSFAVLKCWPDIEKQVMRDLSRMVEEEQDDLRVWMWKDELYKAKERGAVPHDFGSPREDPFVKSNSYNWQNSNLWRDLNADYVLLVYRDVRVTGDRQLLADCWPAVCLAMERLETFDQDNDGLIENTGFPDQTFDNIPFMGPGAYCNSLWIAALAAASEMADMMEESELCKRFSDMRDKAIGGFDKRLWTGTHYRTDTDSEYGNAVFIEQLFGIGYASLCGLGDLLPAERVRKALMTVFRGNYTPGIGVANFSGLNNQESATLKTRYNPDECQTCEALCGINLAYAAHLRQVGLGEQAETVLKTVHDILYNGRGLWFRTPAAWNDKGDFRAIMNLRPLVVWALAFQRSEKKVMER